MSNPSQTNTIALSDYRTPSWLFSCRPKLYAGPAACGMFVRGACGIFFRLASLDSAITGRRASQARPVATPNAQKIMDLPYSTRGF